MIDKVNKGQKIYYYRNIFDVVEEGTVEDPTITTDVFSEATDHPMEFKCIKNVHWDERVYKDGTTASSFGNSGAVLDNVFLTAKEAHEHQDAMIEKCKEKLRGKITCLEDLLRFPLNHCLHDEDFDEISEESYEDMCQKVLSGEFDLCILNGKGHVKGQTGDNRWIWSYIKRR